LSSPALTRMCRTALKRYSSNAIALGGPKAGLPLGAWAHMPMSAVELRHRRGPADPRWGFYA
jgi:hypothetical protein